MAQASHPPFDKTKSQSPATIPYFWIFLVVLNLLLLIDEIQFSNQNWFIALFLVRLAQILVAFFAATSIYFKKEISSDYASLYFLFSLAFGSCFALFEGGENLSRVNINALFYFLLAFSYRGEKKDWIQIYLPVSTFLLLIPIGLRFLNLVSSSRLVYIVLSLVFGNLSLFFRSYFISESFGKIVDEGEPEMKTELKREESFAH